ncbi:hypothetical protein BJ508DRAFT_312394 [Ascobolus immersus RN42]|uniref:C2H2-type domain-containing protein n=1 Tax=Ascobolus immersus RN42 TaxID=1160509 RepID=A0A3N4HPS6_ASCIM|nr:hypothetical protein BJ508DRAFT_312394 [Ascobolus immersus RN42]
MSQNYVFDASDVHHFSTFQLNDETSRHWLYWTHSRCKAPFRFIYLSDSHHSARELNEPIRNIFSGGDGMELRGVASVSEKHALLVGSFDIANSQAHSSLDDGINHHEEEDEVQEGEAMPESQPGESPAITSASDFRFHCPVQSCNRSGGKGFGRRDNLKTHLRDCHNRDLSNSNIRRSLRSPATAESGEMDIVDLIQLTNDRFLCPITECKRSDPSQFFDRRDNAVRHVKDIHGKIVRRALRSPATAESGEMEIHR